ncbi:ABC transporter [Chromatiales bacterium (ex Bugula neritina AB1)]|nr:ABC transporter [Chromatiales bacterium (ex Bugula neritina AB1)]
MQTWICIVTKPLLEIRNLRVETLVNPRQSSAQAIEILKGLNLTLNAGEVMGLIGESGAGKSTLGLAAMGYARRGLHLSAGEVWLAGVELRSASAEVLRQFRGRKVSYVAQSAAAAFNPAHRLLGQILEVTHIHRQLDTTRAAQRAIALFKRMGLPHPDTFGTRYPHEVSGGQLQRAMTAMALAGNPDLIVFDEPTTALDVTTQIEVMAMIREVITDDNTAALYITHDLGVVAQIADRIKVLRDGEEVEEQATAELLANPGQAYTRALLNVRGIATEGSADASSCSLTASHINAAYGDTDVLFNVNIQVRRGSSLAIVGESGSGKSTLARTIMGLLAPKSGQITFNNSPLSSALAGRTAEQRKLLQLIYQQPDTALNPRQIIGEIIGRSAQVFAGLSKAACGDRVLELLELVDLPVSLAARYPNQLSGGQKQRVCIARALAAEPELIICDEVTSALDPLVADGIIELLLRLQRQFGVSYIFITHDMAMVRMIADDVVVMQDGIVVEHGPKNIIFETPASEYTRLLLSSTPEMRTDWLDELLVQRKSASETRSRVH